LTHVLRESWEECSEERKVGVEERRERRNYACVSFGVDIWA
jgi:hypothetical protein